jgi:hypothetical protein
MGDEGDEDYKWYQPVVFLCLFLVMALAKAVECFWVWRHQNRSIVPSPFIQQTENVIKKRIIYCFDPSA